MMSNDSLKCGLFHKFASKYNFAAIDAVSGMEEDPIDLDKDALVKNLQVNTIWSMAWFSTVDVEDKIEIFMNN